MTKVVVVSDSPKKFEYTIKNKLNAELIKLENTVINVEDIMDKFRDSVVLLRVYNMYKLVPIAAISKMSSPRLVINNPDIVIKCVCREVLYEYLRKIGVPTPKRYYVYDICNVSDVVDKVKGRTLLLTFTKSDIDGIVESPQALVSAIEHRFYMSAEDVKVNLFIPNLDNVMDILIIGEEIVTKEVPEEYLNFVKELIKKLGFGIYSIKLAQQEGNIVMLDLDPVPELYEEEHVDLAISFLRRLTS